MTLNLSPPWRSWRLPVVALAFALGAAAAGCGPSKQFCADAADNGYVCQSISDAGKPESDVADVPPMEKGPIIVGDDEDAGTD